MKLEYFPLHGRAMLIRLLLNYCNVQFEDKMVSFQEFGQNKANGVYALGQLPVFYLDDDTQLCQTKAIARYLAKVHAGKNGEVLYAGDADPLQSYQIDEMIDSMEDLSMLAVNFLFP